MVTHLVRDRGSGAYCMMIQVVRDHGSGAYCMKVHDYTVDTRYLSAITNNVLASELDNPFMPTSIHGHSSQSCL